MYSVPSVKLLNEYFTKNQKEPFIPQESLQVFWLAIITLLDIAICCLVLLTKTKSRETPAKIWRSEWDSNPRTFAASLVFKTSSLNHSDI